MLGRNDTTTTLPAYSSRPGSPGGIEMNSIGRRRPIPSRTGTMTTVSSSSTRAPLLGSAAEMGLGRTASPAPAVPKVDYANIPPPGRSITGQSNMRSDGSIRMASGGGPAPSRSMSGRPAYGYDQNGYDQGDTFARSTPAPRQYEAYAPNNRSNTTGPGSTYQGWDSSDTGNVTHEPSRAFQGHQPDQRASPAPYEPYNERPSGPSYYPTRSATGQFPPRGPQYNQPQRNMTAPMPSRGVDSSYDDRGYQSQRNQQQWDYSSEYGQDNHHRTGTPQGRRGPDYGYDVESQRDYQF